MTSPMGNSEFCFPRPSLRSRGNKTHCFPREQSSSVLLYLPTANYKKKLRRNRLLYAGWLTNLPRFQGARFDHVLVESSCRCFPSELVSLTHDTWRVVLQSENAFELGDITIQIDALTDCTLYIVLWSYTVLHCVAKVLILLKTRLIIAVIHTTFWNKNQGLKGIRTHDLCDTSAVQLSYQANCELAKL